MLNQVVVLAEIVLKQCRCHLLRQCRRRPLGAAGHQPQIGAGLVKQRQLALVAAVTAIAHGFGQIQEPPQQLQRQIGIVGGNRPRNRLALPIEIRQQGIAPLLIQPTAGTLHRRQPLAHFLRHLQWPLLLRQRQPQRPPCRRIALGVLQ